MCGEVDAHLSERALADGAVEIKVVEVDVGLEVDFLGAAVTHGRVELEEEGDGGEDQLLAGEYKSHRKRLSPRRPAGPFPRSARGGARPAKSGSASSRVWAEISDRPGTRGARLLLRLSLPPTMPVGLDKIPTLRELYKQGTLKAADAVKLRQGPSSALLDRVSL